MEATGSAVTLGALVLWIPITWILFALLPARRAMLCGVIAGWLILPMAIHRIEGLPDITKNTVLMVSVYSALVVVDRRRFATLRPHWIDLPVLIWIAAAPLASLSAGLGAYDAGSEASQRVLFWLAPYVLGRIYCADRAGARDLMIGFVCGSLAYVPLCVLESEIGPVLHKTLYGYRQHGLRDVYRYGGFRPSGFMKNGLMLATWMALSTLAAGWLWWTRAVPRLFGVSTALWATLLLQTTLLTRSVNAWLLLILGGVLLWLLKRGHVLPLLLVAAVPFVYVGARVASGWSGKELVRATLHTAGIERARSLQYRFLQERRLMKKAWQRPWLGWGGWGRWRIYDKDGQDITISDSAWIISFGQSGLIGMTSLMAIFVVPPIALYRRWPAPAWVSPSGSPVAVMSLIAVLVGIDQCFNSLMTPMYMIAIGGLTGIAHHVDGAASKVPA